MSSIDSQYYSVVKRMSSLVGQWPYQASRIRWFRVSLMTLIALSLFIPQTAKFVRCDGDLQCICESTTSYILVAMVLVKLYTCNINQRKIKRIIDFWFNDWNNLETPEEYEIMKKYTEDGRRYSIYLSWYSFATVSLFMCIPLVPKLLDVVSPLNESRPTLIPYPSYYFVDDEEYFIYIFCHSIVTWETLIIGLLAHDCIFLISIKHVCGIFVVAGLRFKRLTYEDTEPVKTVLSTRYSSHASCRHIAFSVHTHQKALKFVQFLEDMFSLSLMIQVALNAVAISVTLLQITYQDTNILDAVRYVLYIVGQLNHLFYLSAEGQKMIDHSLQLRNSIYNSYWYELPIESQKLILLVMIRSFRPCYLSAGKIYIFSLQGYCTIVQASVSYFTMLASFR